VVLQDVPAAAAGVEHQHGVDRGDRQAVAREDERAARRVRRAAELHSGRREQRDGRRGVEALGCLRGGGDGHEGEREVFVVVVPGGGGGVAAGRGVLRLFRHCGSFFFFPFLERKPEEQSVVF